MAETGIIRLDRQITSTITVLTLSQDKASFVDNFEKAKQRSLPAAEIRKPLVLPSPLRLKPMPLFPWLDAAPPVEKGSVAGMAGSVGLTLIAFNPCSGQGRRPCRISRL